MGAPDDLAAQQFAAGRAAHGARRRKTATRVFAALTALSVVALTVLAPLPYAGRSIASLFHGHRCAHTPPSIPERVARILAATPLIDGHNDLPILVRMLYQNHIYAPNFTFTTTLPWHVDLPRLRQGLLGGTFWSIFTMCPSADNNFTDAVYHQSMHDTLQQIDLVHRLIDAYPSDLALALTPAAAIKAHENGQIASMLGVEGLHMIGNSPATLRAYHSLGVRYVTLNHNCNNKYSDSALPANSPFWHGLSDDGVAIVHEMNRLGMMVDLAHTSHDTMAHTFRVTRAPVIFSHSSAFSICPHPRNVPDEVLHLLAANGGVVMVNFYPEFVRCGPGLNSSDATLEHVADHIMHIGNLIGWRHVGIGSDFDGIETVPVGLEDVGKMPALFEELLRRGVGDSEAGWVAGGNVLRVWAEVERVSQELKKEGLRPVEDDVRDRFPEVEMAYGRM